MAAKEEELGGLHEKLVRTLSTLLDGTELPAETDPETGEVLNEASVIPPSAAILTVVAKVLKDNNITAVASKGSALGELQEKMSQRAAAREARRNATKADLKTATEDMSFMEGLPN